MKPICLVLLYVSMFLVMEIKCQNAPLTYNTQGVSITVANRGTYTDFYVTCSFSQSSGVQLSDSWLGIGINTLQQMNKANVVVCRNSPATKYVKSYYNQGYAPGAVLYPGNDLIGLSNTGIDLVGSNITCKFRRSNTNADPNYINVSSNAALYILVAFGNGKTKYISKIKISGKNSIIN